MEEKLKKQGWHLSKDGLKQCMEESGLKDHPNLSKVVEAALNCDLRHICEKYLPENINSGQVESITGPVVLQIQKIRNVSAPMAIQESQGSPRMIKLNLTDGITHCVAIEFQPIPSLKLGLCPGTKLRISGSNIPVVHGIVLLEESNVTVLGGEVEKLKSKWKANQTIQKKYVQEFLV